MNNSKQEATIVSNKKNQISFLARILPSIFSSSGIGVVLGFLLSMGSTGVDGENGYAVLYNSAIMMFFVFLALIFIGNKRAHIAFAIISALVWFVSLWSL